MQSFLLQLYVIPFKFTEVQDITVGKKKKKKIPVLFVFAFDVLHEKLLVLTSDIWVKSQNNTGTK